MNVRFKDTITASWHHMVLILFKPFRASMWIALFCVALLSGELGGGANFNFPSGQTGEQPVNTQQEEGQISGEAVEEDAASESQPAPGEELTLDQVKNFFKGPAFAAVIAIGIVVLLILILVMWVASRLSFVFLECVVKNTSEILIPFKNNRPEANSYFKWNLALLTISLAFLGIMAAWVMQSVPGFSAWISENPEAGIGSYVAPWIPHLGILVLFILPMLFVGDITRDLVIPVMYKNKLPILSAWRRVLSLVKSHALETFVFYLIKLGLRIGSVIAGIFVAFGLVFIVVMPLAVIVALGFGVSFMLPMSLKIVLMATGLTYLMIWGGALTLLFGWVNLPAAVFFRSFSLNFLAALDTDLNLLPNKD